MKLIDYEALVKSGVSSETIHLIHIKKEKEAISDSEKKEAIITCPDCNKNF